MRYRALSVGPSPSMRAGAALERTKQLVDVSCVSLIPVTPGKPGTAKIFVVGIWTPPAVPLTKGLLKKSIQTSGSAAIVSTGKPLPSIASMTAPMSL